MYMAKEFLFQSVLLLKITSYFEIPSPIAIAFVDILSTFWTGFWKKYSKFICTENFDQCTRNFFLSIEFSVKRDGIDCCSRTTFSDLNILAATRQQDDDLQKFRQNDMV